MRVTLATDKESGWEGLYVDGILRREAAGISAGGVLESIQSAQSNVADPTVELEEVTADPYWFAERYNRGFGLPIYLHMVHLI